NGMEFSVQSIRYLRWRHIMSAKPLIKENNRLREKLNELLIQTVQAQSDGKNIVIVTGEDYKEYAASIIQELPQRNIWKLAGRIALIFLGVMYLFSFFTDLIFNIIDRAPLSITIDATADIFYIVIMSLSGVGFVFLFFHTMQYTLFRNWLPWKDYGFLFIISAVDLLLIMFLGFLKNAVDIGPSIEMSLWFPVVLGIILVMLGYYLLVKAGSNALR